VDCWKYNLNLLIWSYICSRGWNIDLFILLPIYAEKPADIPFRFGKYRFLKENIMELSGVLAHIRVQQTLCDIHWDIYENTGHSTAAGHWENCPSNCIPPPHFVLQDHPFYFRVITSYLKIVKCPERKWKFKTSMFIIYFISLYIFTRPGFIACKWHPTSSCLSMSGVCLNHLLKFRLYFQQ
jgi:hypothetical protein